MMSRYLLPVLGLRYLVLALLFLFAGVGLAQEASPADTPAVEPANASEETTPEPAAETEPPVEEETEPTAAARLVELEAVDAEVRKDLSSEEAAFVPEISEELPVVTLSIDRIVGRLASIRDRSVGANRMISIRESIGDADVRIKNWQQAIIDYSSGLAERIAFYDEQLDRLTTLISGDDQTELPETFVDRVGETVAALQQVRDLIQERSQSVLALQATLSIESRRLSEARQRLVEIEAKTRAGILRPDSPPLWKLFSSSGASDRVVADVSRFVADNWSVFVSFVTRGIHQVVVAVLFYVGVVVFLVSIRKRHAASLDTDSRLETTSAFIRRPFSAAFMIAALATEFLVTDQPEVFDRVLALIGLIALLRLVPVLIPAWLRHVAYGVLFVYLVARIAFIFPESSPLARLLYAGTAAFFCIGGVGFLKRLGKASEPSGILKTFGRISIGCMAISLVANLFGLSILTANIANGVAQLSFVGLALLAAIKATMGFFRLVALLGPLRHLRSINSNFNLVEAQLNRILLFVAVIFWTFVGLAAFSVGDLVLAGVTEFLGREWTIGALAISLGDIAAFVIAIWVATILSRVIRFFLDNDIMPRVSLPRGVPSTISMMVHYGVIVIGIMAALAAAGIHLAQISIVVGALGVGIGFGLQNLVNNFVSGLIMIFERPIKVGDAIQFGTNYGVVQSIGIRASTVRTFDGAEIIVPNGNLISNEVTNWTLSDQRRRIDINVGVAYGTPPEKAIEVIAAAAVSCEKIEKTPEPWVSFDGFGDSSLDFTLRCWTANFDNWLRVKTNVCIAITKALAEAGIEIPFPQRDLHLRSISGDAGGKLNKSSKSEAEMENPDQD